MHDAGGTSLVELSEHINGMAIWTIEQDGGHAAQAFVQRFARPLGIDDAQPSERPTAEGIAALLIARRPPCAANDAWGHPAQPPAQTANGIALVSIPDALLMNDSHSLTGSSVFVVLMFTPTLELVENTPPPIGTLRAGQSAKARPWEKA